MNSRATIAPEAPEVKRASAVSLPLGILGFQHLKQGRLIANPGEEPFLRLQAQEDPSLSFLVLEPFLALPDYRPDIPEQDVSFLQLSSPDDAQLYSIVTVHGPAQATINLKGPLVFNRHTGVGKQVILNNAADYSIHHPLAVTG